MPFHCEMNKSLYSMTDEGTSEVGGAQKKGVGRERHVIQQAKLSYWRSSDHPGSF